MYAGAIFPYPTYSQLEHREKLFIHKYIWFIIMYVEEFLSVHTNQQNTRKSFQEATNGNTKKSNNIKRSCCATMKNPITKRRLGGFQRLQILS